jgi:EpsI family protein
MVPSNRFGMSIIDVTARPDVTIPQPAAAGPPRRDGAARWARVGLACLLLAASGGVRWLQVRRVESVLRDARNSPFPLRELPMTLGSWRGEEAALDPKIVRGTGATDLVTRRYVDRQTGATIDAIVLYGPSTEVYIHMPENCYPAAGFEQVGAADDRTVKAGPLEVPVRALVYTKGEGGQGGLQEVYYSWRYSGHWSPVLGAHKKFERIPGMYKVHLSRPVTERERRDIGNPCESFLEALIPEIERRLAEPGRPTEGRVR